MKTRLAPLLAISAILLAGIETLASAETIVVEDNGGPGVDFTNLPPAIAAAEPGDLLFVRAGVYSSFTVNEGIRILAEPGARVTLDGFGRTLDLPWGRREQRRLFLQRRPGWPRDHAGRWLVARHDGQSVLAASRPGRKLLLSRRRRRPRQLRVP